MGTRFVRIDPDPELQNLIMVLKARLPQSAHVLNMALVSHLFKDEMSFYKLDEDPNETPSNSKCWILGKYMREDTGQQITISAPSTFVGSAAPDQSDFLPLPRTLEARLVEAFQTSTAAIDWTSPIELIGIERPVTHLILHVSAHLNGNTTQVIPCLSYIYPHLGLGMMERKESNLQPFDIIAQKNLDGVKQEGVGLASLNSSEGLQFLCQTWPYVNEGTLTFRSKNVGALPSSGVFLTTTSDGHGGQDGSSSRSKDGPQKFVSGTMLHPTGHIGVVTESGFRRKGYARFSLIGLISTILSQKRGIIPCCFVNVYNQPSRDLSMSSGLEESHSCDFIFVKQGHTIG